MWHPNYKFPESLKSADDETKKEYFSKKFVMMHERIKSINNKINSEFFNSLEQQIALVVGPTGVGKTCLAQAMMKSCYKNIPDSDRYKNLPMVYYEPDVNSVGKFSWKDFYRELLLAIGELNHIRVYGCPEPAGEYGARKYVAKNRKESELKSDLQNRLKEYGVKYFLLDEIQHIFKYGGKSEDRSLDILKSISNKSGCRFIGLGTYEILFSLDKSAQIARRSLNIEFSSYMYDCDSEITQFQSAFMGLLAHIPIQLSSDVGSSVEEVFIGCCGCIGVLKEWLNRALVIALEDDSQLSMKHLRKTRLKGNQLIPIAQEIKEGKAFFEEPDDDDIALLLGLRGGVDGSVKPNPSGGKPGNRRPGERKPVRDIVL